MNRRDHRRMALQGWGEEESDARASSRTANGRFMTIVAGGQRAPRKRCLSSSTGRIRSSRAFGSRAFLHAGHPASNNVKSTDS